MYTTVLGLAEDHCWISDIRSPGIGLTWLAWIISICSLYTHISEYGLSLTLSLSLWGYIYCQVQQTGHKVTELLNPIICNYPVCLIRKKRALSDQGGRENWKRKRFSQWDTLLWPSIPLWYGSLGRSVCGMSVWPVCMYLLGKLPSQQNWWIIVRIQTTERVCVDCNVSQ